MIPPSLDFTSDLFDAYEALHSNKIVLPYPKIKTYNNIAEYYSHTFLKKAFEPSKSSKNNLKPRERNYEWYYDTLGLTEYQRNCSRGTKTKKKRPRKKPVSVVTIPGSPLRSEKITICKSDFRDYCRRKYRSLNITSDMDKKSEEFKNVLSDSTSESSYMPSVIKNGPPTSVLPFIKNEAHTLSTPLSVITTELPSTSHVAINELFDSSNDSFTDDMLIFKMKSNLQQVCALPNAYGSTVSFQIKQGQVALSLKRKHAHRDSKHMHYPYQSIKLSEISNQDTNRNSNLKSNYASNNTECASSSQVKDLSASTNMHERSSKKHEKSSDCKLIKEDTTCKLKKKSIKTEDDSINVLDGPSPKSVAQNITCQEKSVAYKEISSVNDSNFNKQFMKKNLKSSLKSQENVLDCMKKSSKIETESQPNIMLSRIKTENCVVINHCTCNFPCGMSNLCTCGYYANAKKALNKFKIPRKNK